MFHTTPPTPTKNKKVVYILSWVVLGLLLSLLVNVFIELKYFDWVQNNQWAQENSQTISSYELSPLNPVLRIGLFVAGALFGFWQGKFWWRKVYIEQTWWKNKKSS